MDAVPRFLQSLTEGLVGVSAGLLALRSVMPPIQCNPNPDRDVLDCVRLNVTMENPVVVGIPGSFWPYHSFDDTGPKFIAGRLDRAFRKTCLLECPWFTNATYPNVPNVTVTPSTTPSKVHHWYALEKVPDVTYANLPGDWELVDRKVPGMFDRILRAIASFVISTGEPNPDAELVAMVFFSSLLVLISIALVYAGWCSVTDWYDNIIEARVTKKASSREEDRLRYNAIIEGLTQRIVQLEASDRKKEELQRKATLDAIHKRIAQLEAQLSGTSAEVKRIGNRNDTLHGNFSNQQRETRKHDKFVNDMMSRMADMERTVDGTEEDINRLNARDKTLSATISEFQQQTRDRIADLERSIDGTEEDIHRLENRDDLMLRLVTVEEAFKRLNTRDSEVSAAIAGYERDFSGHQQLFAKYQAEVREHEPVFKDFLERLVTLEEGSRRLDAHNTDFSVLLSDHKRVYEREMSKHAKGIEDLAQGTIDLAKHHTELEACHDNLSEELRENRQFVMGEIEKHIAAHDDLDTRHIELDTRHKAMDSLFKSLNSRFTALDTRSKEMVDSVKHVAGLREDFRNMDTRQKALDASHKDLDGRQDDIDARQKTALDDLNARHKDLDTRQKDLNARQDDIDALQKSALNNLNARHIDLDTRHKALDASHIDLDTRQKDLDTRQKAANDEIGARHKALDSFVKTLDSRAQALAARQSDTETRSKEMRERVINACNSLGSWNHKAGEEFNVVLQNFDGFEGSMVAALSATFHALHHIHARVLPPGMPRPGFPGSPGFSPGRPMQPQFPPGPFPQPQWPQPQWVQSQWAPVQAPHGLQGPIVQSPSHQSSAPQSPAPQGNGASPRQQGTPGKGPQAQTPSK